MGSQSETKIPGRRQLKSSVCPESEYLQRSQAMTSTTYLIGDATHPSIPGPKVIAHICNDIGGWGKGFVLAITKRWSEPETEYREWFANRESNDFGLGMTQFVKVGENLWIANMIAQHYIKAGNDGAPPTRYDAVKSCLARLARFASDHGATVHMPRIGCGLAGGTWDQIEPLIEQTCGVAEVPVFVYDFGRR